jgi:lipoate-protein ligase A
MPKQRIRLLFLDHYPIFEQLQLEEALLRADDNQWCLISGGTAPAIVMGISGKVEQLINVPLLQQRPVPLIRRFSGGGTVFVDQHTCFITWICNSKSIDVSCCPKAIMQWTENIYKKSFSNIPFALRENDYVLGDKKCGGNAQYMRKDRWLHHTSFLWDFHTDNMNYLLHPPKMPVYRQQRNHNDFLCRLRDHLPHKEEWLLSLKDFLREHFDVIEMSREQALEIMHKPHRKATMLVEIP